jgi:Tfp pilus assembly protein PilF
LRNPCFWISTWILCSQKIWDDLDPQRLPWIFPEVLYEKIASTINDIDVLTIAYSVEGGFTPLKFKYLGDELQCYFRGTKPKAMDYKRKAFYFETEKRRADAAASYEEALKIDGGDASTYYNLALLHLESAAGKAAFLFSEAVSRDRSYTTRYNNYGILYLQYNKPEKAEEEYEKFLAVNENNAAVLTGLGYIALARRRYAKADTFFNRSLMVDNNSSEARAGKGIISFKKNRLPEARAIFSGLITARPDDAEAYWWLGRITQKQGEVSGAIDNYKDAVMRGGEGPLVHLLLSGLYVKKRLYYRAFEELKRSFSVLRTMS